MTAGALDRATRISFVSELYGSTLAMATGILAGVGCGAAVAVETGLAVGWWVAGAVAAVGVARHAALTRFRAVREVADAAALDRWEAVAVALSTAQCLAMTCFAVVGFALTDDRLCQGIGIGAPVAYMVATMGRSFASRALARWQMACAGTVLLVVVPLGGHGLWTVDAFVILPFLVALNAITRRLHDVFARAVTLAGRLDAALGGMPVGLAMTGADGAVAVSNARFLETLGVGDAPATGAGLVTLWATAGDGGAVGRLLADPGRAGEAAFDDASGRSLVVRSRPAPDGGCVLVVDDVTEREAARREIDHLARYDALTGLLNRRSLDEAARAAMSVRGGAHALLFVDLDRFKQVNDTLGHPVGDRLVVAAAGRLLAVAGPDATVGRVGGDEFVVVVAADGGVEAAEALAGAVVATLSAPYAIDGHRVVIGASVGVALSGDVADFAALVRDADTALYRAKAEGRGGHRVFEPWMKEGLERRRRLVADVGGAVGRGELTVRFQPVHDAAAHRYLGCEAMPRWEHPAIGPVSREELAAVSREAGVAEDLGGWVTREALAACARWPAGTTVAVRASARALARGDLDATVLGLLAEAGLPPGRLAVAVTEAAAREAGAEGEAALRPLARAGVGLALDGFGTGEGSLALLGSLPFDAARVDGSLLRGLGPGSRPAVLLAGIVAMGRALGTRVVVDGVATLAELALVTREAGVELVQGPLLSPPLSAGEAADVLWDQERLAA